jgi:uracil-DNA glycosylase family 4
VNGVLRMAWPNNKVPRFAEGPDDADIMLVGQNPGKEEVKQGRPFVGRSGQYLNKILRHNGLDRSRLYITAVVKEPTPKNRKPRIAEIDRWMPTLVAEIEHIKPRIIVLMGRVAWRTPRFEGIEYIETYHPAAAMRFPEARKRFEADMRKLKVTGCDSARQ